MSNGKVVVVFTVSMPSYSVTEVMDKQRDVVKAIEALGGENPHARPIVTGINVKRNAR